MKLIDLLLLVAAAGLIAAGFTVHPSLGELAIAVSGFGLWFLLGEADE